MSYKRVIPRDLFNEANLLKCYGQLYLELEKLGKEDCLVHLCPDAPFYVIQNIDGWMWVSNLHLVVRGTEMRLYRTLNSREPYPLYMMLGGEFDDLQVFNDDGSFTDEMKEFLCK